MLSLFSAGCGHISKGNKGSLYFLSCWFLCDFVFSCSQNWKLLLPWSPGLVGVAMSEDGDVDVESAEDVPEIGGEATATTANQRLYVRTGVVSTLYQRCLENSTS